MRVLCVATDHPNFRVEETANAGVARAPAASLHDPVTWREVVSRYRPVVLLAPAAIPHRRLVEWAELVLGRALVVVQWIGKSHTASVDVSDDAGITRLLVPEDTSIDTALKAAERVILSKQYASLRRPRVDDPAHRPQQAGRGPVTLVGCGAVNLVTALQLAYHGFEVEVLEARPDPRESRPWQQYGCTRGGGNARMFTLTEADQYSGLDAPRSGDTVFDAPPALLGWDIRRADQRDLSDETWVREYKQVPRWLAEQYESDILAFNRESQTAWEQLFETYPSLASATNLHRGILRVYSTPSAFQREVSRHLAVGDLVTTYSGAEVRERFPAFSRADPGALAGGIAVEGFTVDIHRFVAAALDALEAKGAKLHFDLEVTGIGRDGDGLINALRVGDSLLKTRNVVISPGAYGGDLLAELGLGGQVAGVLGLWHTLPNSNGQEHSVKVCRPETAAPDANLTVGEVDDRPSLIVGSGYGFVGSNVKNVDPEQLKVIQRSVDAMMRTLLPDAYEEAGGTEWLRHDPVYCVRPWTPTSLGIFDVQATAEGICIITAGHNTGGFAQAPAVANAVLASLAGKEHPMHRLYWPRRSRLLFPARSSGAAR